ncbi:MAG: hypothetical protein KC493_08715 [Bacteriovoracaceae bacterium]|nr:hypothetical protein [Bacteriovoracaceae bacterium]
MEKIATNLIEETCEPLGSSVVEALIKIITAKSSIGKSGFPVIGEDSFQHFLDRVPHILRDGQRLVEILDRLENKINSTKEVSGELKESLLRSIEVLRRVTLTSGVTAPPDLWLLRQVLSTFDELNLNELILSKKWFSRPEFAAINNLDATQLKHDLKFLLSRGYLENRGEEYKISSCVQARNVFEKCKSLPSNVPRNIIDEIVAVLSNSGDPALVQQFLEYEDTDKPVPGWIAGVQEIEVGFRLLPIVLAVRYLDINRNMKEHSVLSDTMLNFTPEMEKVLVGAGALKSNGTLTLMGERIFARGPGPYGIIHAYHGYMTHHQKVLRGNREGFWVARGENVAASQDANSKSFKQINDSLDSFCSKYKFQYDVYIEHAVGQGEATRQRFNSNGEKDIQYFGADLEDAAIDKSVENQKKGKLPSNMKFVRNADIGKPEILIKGIEKEKSKTENSVMVVGNGFHEVRDQTNEKMIETFSKYSKAGIIICFTEESGLLDEDLLFTGWNTYHAGFRYVHEISGQGLRPAIDNDEGESARYSWKKCATYGGYRVLEEFTTRTRTIYPNPKKDGYNPAISVNYFCIPESLAKKLGV